MIRHNGSGAFLDLPTPFEPAIHSLSVERRSFPASLEITAESDDGEIMALAPLPIPVQGVQFQSRISPHARRQKKSQGFPFGSATLNEATTHSTPNEFSQLRNRGNVSLFSQSSSADGETPVSAFKKLWSRQVQASSLNRRRKNDVSGRFSFCRIRTRWSFKATGANPSCERGNEGDSRLQPIHSMKSAN